MAVLRFKTVLENDGVIHLPDEVSDQLAAGDELTISIERAKLVSEMTPDEAWAALLDLIEQRAEQGVSLRGDRWRREDLYEHLEERFGPFRTD